MKYIIGIDLGGTNLKLGLFDFRLKIKDKLILTTPRLNKGQLIAVITDSLKKLLVRNRLAKKNIAGVGLGLPGPIDSGKGIVHFFPNIPGWKKVPLKTILKNKLGLPVYIDNDVNLMAVAEHEFGAAKKFQNVICLTLGTGIGGGIIIQGRLYRGSSYAAGEIGHIPINEIGPLCNCKGMACIESYIGNQRILNQAKRLFQRAVSLEELSQLAKKKNKMAVGIWQEVGRKLGIALTGVINLLDPDCIIIGGGVANAGKVLFASIKNTIKKRAMFPQVSCVKIFQARLGEDAGMLGAAILAKERGRI